MKKYPTPRDYPPWRYFPEELDKQFADVNKTRKSQQ